MQQTYITGRVAQVQERQGKPFTGTRTYVLLHDLQSRTAHEIPFPKGVSVGKHFKEKNVTYRVRELGGELFQTLQHRPGMHEDRLPYHANKVEKNSRIYDAVQKLAQKVKDASKTYSGELTDKL